MCFQPCHSSLLKALLCSGMPEPLCKKASLIKTRFEQFDVKDSSGLQIVLTSTLLNTLEMNWNTNYEPDLLIQHQYLISQMICWLNVHKFSDRLLHKRMGHVLAANGGALHNDGHGFGMGSPTSSYRCDGLVSSNFWLYSVS